MQKVSHGQTLRTALRAETWNAFVDAAQYVKDRQMERGGRGEDLPDDTVLVRNDSGYDVPRYGVVWLQSALGQGTASSWEILIAKRPTCPFLSRIGIAAEPMAAGESALRHVWVAGHHPVLIDTELAYDAVQTYPKFATTQADSFELQIHHGSWGIPIIAYYGSVNLRMAALPIVPPPMVRIRLTADQAEQLGMPDIGLTGPTYFDAAFLSFPDSDLSEIDYYGLSVE